MMLVTAVFAKGRVDAIVSGACILGRDATEEGSRGKMVFNEPRNHPSAVASILRHDADLTNFHPRQKQVTDQRIYDRFVDGVYKFDGFESHKKQNRQLDLQGDREQFKKEIAKKYTSQRNDPKMMARAFDHLLPREMSEDDQEWLLNYVVMNTGCNEKNMCDIELEIVSIKLTLCRASIGDETTIKPQMAEMTINSFSVKREYLIKHASTLAQDIRTMKAQEALKELSSNGELGGCVDNYDDEELQLESWLQGFSTPDYPPRVYPISRWNVQF